MEPFDIDLIAAESDIPALTKGSAGFDNTMQPTLQEDSSAGDRQGCVDLAKWDGSLFTTEQDQLHGYIHGPQVVRV
jgi:hypothetical protein